ncbi:MAG: CRISPR-associated endonuclease Cas1, partial [Pseudomonadota bacterium]|nr:CRISPR-associated endonuclease Cas1 [Pseudomonadota bacterium]
MIVNTACNRSDAGRPCKLLPDARPLYIAPVAETRVDLDGPALRVRREKRAEQLFPLQRISRVYSAERVDWASEALLACAGLGISVLFVDDEGEVVARLLG